VTVSRDVLLDCVYLVVPPSPEIPYTSVYKLTADPKDRKNYQVSEDSCSCEAGKFGNDCKHVQMALGRLVGPLVSKRRALRSILSIESAFKNCADVRAFLHLPPRTREVRKAEAAAWVNSSPNLGPYYEFWGSRETVVRIRCFTDKTEFERVRSEHYPRPAQEPGMGTTYGGTK
jgi:hypothetical protein